MILRKPYALLIKYFKLIHVVLLAALVYLIYKTGILLHFFNQCVNSSIGIGDSLVITIFNNAMFILPFVIIVISIILLSIMIIKKKPCLFYIINIVFYIFVVVLFNVAHKVTGDMEIILVNIRTVRLIRDLLTIAIILQVISIAITIIRATGFDIKKFNFGQDLQELEITEEDNEEFEVGISFESNVFKRNIRRNFRHAKYVYIENMFLINVISLIVVVAIGVAIYLNVNVYNKKIDMNSYFKTTYFNMRVTKSYLTKKDYKNIVINDNVNLVVVELELNSQVLNGRKLDTVNMELFVGSYKFRHTNKYRDNLIDLGMVYDDMLIKKDITKILLVFEIPKQLFSNDMELRYSDEYVIKKHALAPKYTTIKLQNKKLDENIKRVTLEMTKSADLKESILNKTVMTINSYELKERFALNYNFCITTTECYPSIEVLMPALNKNEDKALLKINGNVVLDDKLQISKVHDLYDLINYFGTITYETNGVVKTQSKGLAKVIPHKLKDSSIYIEVPKEVLNANKISLNFDFRNYKVEYILK